MSLTIGLQFTDSKGRQKTETLVQLPSTIEEVISAEEERRSALLARFLMAGSVFSSSNYGDLLLLEDGTFSWTSYQRLVPSVIPSQEIKVSIILRELAFIKDPWR